MTIAKLHVISLLTSTSTECSIILLLCHGDQLIVPLQLILMCLVGKNLYNNEHVAIKLVSCSIILHLMCVCSA